MIHMQLWSVETLTGLTELTDRLGEIGCKVIIDKAICCDR